MQAVKLSEFFEICRNLDFGRGQKYVKIEKVIHFVIVLLYILVPVSHFKFQVTYRFVCLFDNVIAPGIIHISDGRVLDGRTKTSYAYMEAGMLLEMSVILYS